MPVENRIIKIQKRNRALVTFDERRICEAILRAARSIGGFQMDRVAGVNDTVFHSCATDDAIAGFLSDCVVMCLNADPHHHTSNFPPTIETIQDGVLHVLRSHGFLNTYDAFACYRWGRHWLREGAISQDQFVGNGVARDIIDRQLEWNRQHGCDTLSGLNDIIRAGRLKPLIEESQNRYEAELDAAAQRMLDRMQGGDRVRLLWITGPSSSGKTTTTVKLTQRLQKRGLRFLMLNLDDYFWSVVEHPTDWINDRNYETPEALDIQLLNQHLRALLEGQTVDKPTYCFKQGRRTASKRIRLEPDQILLLDCLHGLYPPITEGIDSAAQFRIYIENMNALLEGDGRSGRLVRFTDVRLLRRMLRDALFRNHSPLLTLLHWHYVRAGELFSILPLRGLADVVINGGMPFEPAILKPFLTGADGWLPSEGDLDRYPGFLDARIRLDRIRRLLDSVEGIPKERAVDPALLPGDSLLREFVGGGTLALPHNTTEPA